uniref:Uncharacterized protein n=1 Tax=Panstrongylus lignarius TaxID=156445 RepID=A0A224Y2K2_9HEMI
MLSVVHLLFLVYCLHLVLILSDLDLVFVAPIPPIPLVLLLFFPPLVSDFPPSPLPLPVLLSILDHFLISVLLLVALDLLYFLFLLRY